MLDPTAELVNNINSYFLSVPCKSTTLVKCHSEKLKSIGDISFTTNSSIWIQSSGVSSATQTNLSKNIFLLNGSDLEDEKNKFISHSRSWQFPIKDIALLPKDRCAVFLEKSSVINYIFQEILVRQNYARAFVYGEHDLFFEAVQGKENILSFHRAGLACQVMSNIWDLVDKPSSQLGSRRIHISSVASNDFAEEDFIIKCGLVLDPVENKVSKITTEEYINLRSTDMRLTAMHKYGLRIKDKDKFFELIDKLGRAAVTVDLLEVKITSPVKIIRNGQGSTKGASFILYNSARIETLLRTFEDRVESGEYPKLPDLNDIDISVLCENEEWQMIYGYIFQYPKLITDSIREIENGQFSVHTIVQFLNGLVSVFSVYYRRIRILMQNRFHLLPSVFARIYLVKCVRYILNSCLGLLNIQPVHYM